MTACVALVWLILTIPRVSAGVRRFHDTNRLGFAPILLCLLVYYPQYSIIIRPYLPIEIQRYNFPFINNNFTDIYWFIAGCLTLFVLFHSALKGDARQNKYGIDPLNHKMRDEVERIGRDYT